MPNNHACVEANFTQNLPFEICLQLTQWFLHLLFSQPFNKESYNIYMSTFTSIEFVNNIQDASYEETSLNFTDNNICILNDSRCILDITHALRQDE